MKPAIPAEALRQHIAFLGKTGSGKTSTAKLTVEQIFRTDPTARVCVLDPIKSDWWGLTSSADGKKPGLPFYILGGPRGHVPLHESAGKAIGELVANGSLPLSIIDMADFKPGGLQRFFNDFAPALMKRMRGVVYLVLEEAHEFAPKERSGIGAENMAIHYAKQLATAGRSKGIRIMVVTQRTQALHNALLGSCDTMVAHRLTAPADQEPVKKWLKANVSKEIFEQVSSSLSSLKTGSAWLCSGEAQVAELVQFPKITTFDNSATPTGNESLQDVKTAPVDQEKLRAIIGTAVKEAEADDPKVLRSEIARLTADLKKAPARTQPMIDPTAVIVAEQRGFAEGFREAQKQGARAFHDLIKDASEFFDSSAREFAQAFGTRVPEFSFSIPETGSPARLPSFVSQGAKPAGASHPVRRAAAPPAPRQSSPAAGGDDSLTNPQRQLLQALAWWRHMGHDRPTRTQVAAIAGWKPKGSNLRNRLTELSSLGLVTYPQSGTVELTERGVAAAPAPDISRTLIDSIRSVLTNPQMQLFDALIEIGGSVERATLADAVNWEPGGSNLRNRLTELSQLEVVKYPSRGTVALQDWVLG